jgi:hypothetical protein
MGYACIGACSAYMGTNHGVTQMPEFGGARQDPAASFMTMRWCFGIWAVMVSEPCMVHACLCPPRDVPPWLSEVQCVLGVRRVQSCRVHTPLPRGMHGLLRSFPAPRGQGGQPGVVHAGMVQLHASVHMGHAILYGQGNEVK